MCKRGFWVVLSLLGCAVSHAHLVDLTHNGSAVTINSHTATVVSWLMADFSSHVRRHSWYFRDGDGVVASSIGDIGVPTETFFGTQGAEFVYSNNDLTVTLNYFLQANSNGTAAQLVEQVTFETNFGIDLRLFQYSNYNLSNNGADDFATRLNSSTIAQFDSEYSATTGATPIPDFSEIDAPSTLRQSIEGTAGYYLSTAAGDGIGETVNGDVAFAYQWNRNLSAGQSFVMSTNKVAAVPEPATLAVLGLGALALLRRRKKTSA